MFDKISHFFKDISERIRNPFFSSYIITFLVANWRVVIGLVSYNRNDYKELGCETFIGYVNHYTNFWSLVVIPLGGAAFYILVFPWIRNLINVYIALARTKGNNQVLKKIEGGHISIEKYLKLREEYRAKVEELVTTIAQESDMSEKNIELTGELNGLKLKLEKLEKKKSTLERDVAKFKSLSEGAAAKLTFEKQRNNKLEVNIAERIAVENFAYSLSGEWEGNFTDNMLGSRVHVRIDESTISIQASREDLKVDGRILLLKLSEDFQSLQFVAAMVSPSIGHKSESVWLFSAIHSFDRNSKKLTSLQGEVRNFSFSLGRVSK